MESWKEKLVGGWSGSECVCHPPAVYNSGVFSSPPCVWWTGWGFLACGVGPLWCLEAGSEWDWWGSRPPPPPSCPTMSPPRAPPNTLACQNSPCARGKPSCAPPFPIFLFFISPFMLFNSFIACSVHLVSCFLPFSVGTECPGSSKAQKWCVVCVFLLYSFSLSESNREK